MLPSSPTPHTRTPPPPPLTPVLGYDDQLVELEAVARCPPDRALTHPHPARDRIRTMPSWRRSSALLTAF
ncbi:hypothetical protein CTI14_39515 [Methylobacterium radiotolerans]|nr:hypothetical protein CTI14_39515 [Methylobacterium radiotolerans]